MSDAPHPQNFVEEIAKFTAFLARVLCGKQSKIVLYVWPRAGILLEKCDANPFSHADSTGIGCDATMAVAHVPHFGTKVGSRTLCCSNIAIARALRSCMSKYLPWGVNSSCPGNIPKYVCRAVSVLSTQFVRLLLSVIRHSDNLSLPVLCNCCREQPRWYAELASHGGLWYSVLDFKFWYVLAVSNFLAS